MEEATLTDWMDRYVAAWRSNDPDEIGALFTEDARYYTAPSAQPWEGRDNIISGWHEIRDEPDTWTFRYDVMAVVGDRGFVRGWTTYTHQNDYDNLWVIRMEGDRCAEFVEWFMVPEKA